MSILGSWIWIPKDQLLAGILILVLISWVVWLVLSELDRVRH